MCVLDLAMSASSAAPASKRAKTDDDTKGMMKTLIDRLVARENLSAADVSRATEAIAAGRVAPTQISAFLVLLRAKGETSEEVVETMMQAYNVGVSIFTIGQYLRPTKNHLEVKSYVSKDSFDYFKSLGLQIGFDIVESGPLVRSSYHADEQARLAIR